MKMFFHFFGILFILSASRFIPHPPNFTSLLAISFYIPFFMGRNYIPAILISFVITDLIIGYHNTTHWTWGSVFLIGIMAKYFPNRFSSRVIGAMTGAIIFFIVTNFGVWTTGMYGLTLVGLKTSYILAIPFFTYSLISTLLFSAIIEAGYKILYTKFKLKKL